MTRPSLTEATIRQAASAESFARGEQYYRQGAVSELVQRGDALEAQVEGSAPVPYRVRVTFDASGIAEATCTCPYTWGGWCKHVVAALLALQREPAKVEERPPLPSLLANLDAEQLRALLIPLLERDPDLADVVEGQLALLALRPPAAAASRAAPQCTPIDVRAIRRQVQSSMHSLDRGRASEAYGYGGGVVDEVRQVLAQAEALVAAGNGRDALAVLEAITEEYLAGWEMIDDSDTEGSDFFTELGAVWTEAVLSADLTPEERADWSEKLATWQGELADYGVDETFASAVAAAEEGWDDPALQRLLRGEAAVPEDASDEDGEADLASSDQLIAARLNVLERQGRQQEYLRLAAATGQAERYTLMLVQLGRLPEALAYGLERFATAQEALSLAKALREGGETRGALQVAEHALDLEGSKAELAGWLRDLAAEMGETALALRAALTAFEASVSLASFLRVQELAGERWPKQRAELLERLRRTKSYYPQAQVDIFLHEGLIEDAIAAVDDGATHTLVEKVVDAAVASHPEWVIRACRKQAEGIMDGGKAKYYAAAAHWLGKARAAYVAAGQDAEWRAYYQSLLERHHRKYRLMPLLTALG